MPRQKELFEPTLEAIRARAKELYPNKLVYRQEEAAKIMGVCTKTLQNRGLSHFITAEQLAREFS